jgi:hypothetical protein
MYTPNAPSSCFDYDYTEDTSINHLQVVSSHYQLNNIISQNPSILTFMKIRGTVFWDVTPCNLAHLCFTNISEKQQ